MTSAEANVTGDQNQNLIAGGDINIGNTYNQENPIFFEPVFKKYEQPASALFIKPRVGGLLRAVEEQRLIIIGGPYLYKYEIIRYCSFLLKQKVTATNIQPSKVYEWYKTNDPQSLVSNLEQVDDPTIYVLQDIEPSDINYDIRGIANAIADRHFVLITTNKSKDIWNLSNQLGACWHELVTDELYKPGELAAYLDAQLNVAQISLTQIYQDEDLAITILRLAEQLKIPEKIDIFISLLPKNRLITKEDINSQLIRSGQEEEAIRYWFHYLLTPTEQLLALGLSFFDGLSEDQVFAALEKLTESVWRKRDSSLQFLDYGDLKNLMNYFRFYETRNENRRITSLFPDQRKLIFQAAWDSHRRLILTSLPVMAELVIQSVDRRDRSYELYGTSERRDLIRRVIGNTISDIGRLSPSAVESVILQFAADANIGVQAVAARAMARWHSLPDIDLFERLEQWRRGRHYLDLLTQLFNDRGLTRSYSVSVYIRKLIALTIGYVALQEVQNQLPDPLIVMFDELALDSDDAVLDCFGRYTLQFIFPIHFQQLSQRILKLPQNPKLIYPLAIALGLAHKEHSDSVESVVAHWIQSGKSDVNTDIQPSVITFQEQSLAIAVLTYSRIRYIKTVNQGQTGQRTADWAFTQVAAILRKFHHPYVRHYCLEAISRLLEYHFDVCEHGFKSLYQELTNDEKQQVIGLMTDIYLRQRQSLEGGEEVITVNGKKYPVWIDSSRPLTKIEKVIYGWSMVNGDSQGFCLAYLIEFSFFETFNLLEQAQIKQLIESRDALILLQHHHVQKNAYVADFSDEKLNFLVQMFAVPLATINHSHDVRLKIKTILPKVLKQDTKTLDNILNQYQQDGRSEIALALKSAIWYSRNIKFVLVAFITVILFLGILF